MHADGLNRTLALQLVLPNNGQDDAKKLLYYPDDYFVGMQIELANTEDELIVEATDCFPWPYEATTFALLTRPRGCPRMITSYSAASRRVGIYPPWKLAKKMILDGVSVRIRPLMMPGDRFTVYADSEIWKSTIGLDWINEMLRADVTYRKSMVLTMQLACERLPAGGAHNTVHDDASPATFLRDHGFGPLQVTCTADVAQQATLAVPRGSDLNVPCSQVCQSDRVTAELEMKTGVCIYNQTHVMGVVGTESSVCNCNYTSNVPLKIEFKIPDANPLWDRGLNGSGQVIGLADTGLDASNCLLSEKHASAAASSNMVRPVDVNTGAGQCCAGACCADSTDTRCCLDLERRKLVGYHLTSTTDCALCDTCAKRIKWDRSLLFGDVAKVKPGTTFLTPFPHRCGDASDAIDSPLLLSLKCCGHSCPGLRSSGCIQPASACGICECRLNPIDNTIKVCSTADKLDKFEPPSDCDEDNCRPCCHACSHDARLWPRRYDKYGAELEVNIIAKAQPPGDFPVKFRLFVFDREDYERYVVWSESNPGKDPINEDPTSDDQMPIEERPKCLNADCMLATSEKVYEGKTRIKLPPSRYGYGVVMTNGESLAVTKHTFVLYGQLKDGAGLQMYTASRPCGDTSDDAGGHGTLCASVAAGSVDPDVADRAERLVARQYQGVAKGAGLFMFDLSAGSRGADNITVPIDFYSGVLQPSYDRGVRIMSNSWSCYFPQVVCDQLGCVPTKHDYCNSYSTAATDMDTFVFDRPQMLLLAPAGDANALAYDVPQKSIRSPGTCKNCISVGSSHSYNSAILQAIPYMDAMDKMSAPLRSHRALCPRHLLSQESLWRKEEAVAADVTETEAPADDVTADDATTDDATTPAGGLSLDDFREKEDKYPLPADCCNDDPKHNSQIQGFIDFRNDQLQIQRENNSPLVIIEKTLEVIAEQKARLFPCTFEPSCCNLNSRTQDDKIDKDDWTSLGAQQATCCKASYAKVTRPTNALHRSDFDIDMIAGFSGQGPVQDDATLKGENPGKNPAEGGMRIKPDLVAPGAYLVGANSRGQSSASNLRHCRMHGDREQVFNENNTLVSMGGTSIATAAMAGAAAIVRQYFEDGFYPSGRRVEKDKLTPSAALLKAVLITSAKSVTDDASVDETSCKTYTKGLLTDICVPNYQEGWGRPNIGSVLKLADTGGNSISKQLWISDETNGFVTAGWVHEYIFLVDMTSEFPLLDVSLVWSDPAPLPGTETALVNDLDLIVNTTMAVGWVNGKICDIDPFTNDYFEDPALCQKPIPDRVNNVEKTEFDVRHFLVCTYGNGEAIEFGSCKKEATLGAIVSQEKDRRPMQVSVKVVAHRVLRPCVSDGYYKTCTQRAQPYSLVVSGALLVRQSDQTTHPPAFHAYQMSSNFTNSSLSGAVRTRGAVGGGGWGVVFVSVVVSSSCVLSIY